MNLFQAIILGLVQGLGEFLPISSSAHLVLAPWLLGFSDPGLSFDVALHFGTLIAIGAYFWRDWVEILKLATRLPRRQAGNLKPENYNTEQKNSYSLPATRYKKNIFWLIVIATIPGALAGYFLERQAETVFRSPLLIAGTLSVVGLILYLADRYAKHKKDVNGINTKDAVIIGLSQALAIIPGVSRAGATITSGLFLGLNRESAARFSFLMSAPIIFGAVVMKIGDFFSSGFGIFEIVAILTAAVSGYAAIAFLLKFVEKTSYKIFFWYRMILAIIILMVYFFRT